MTDEQKDKVEEQVEEQPEDQVEEPTAQNTHVMPDLPDLPDLDLEDFEPPEEEGTGAEDKTAGSLKYAYVGVGQGGGRLAKAFYDLGNHKVIAVNTAKHDLSTLALPDTHKFIASTGNEEGAGKNMSVGAGAVRAHREEIFNLMRRVYGTDVDHIMVCFGAGGGSGGGGFEPMIEIARRYLESIGVDNPDNRVGVVVSLPNNGEASSPQVASNAVACMTTIDHMPVSPVLVVDNEKIGKMRKGLPPKKFWTTVNNDVGGLFNIFNILSNTPSEYQAFDPADYATVIRTGGCMVLGVTTVKDLSSETSVADAVKSNLFKTLLAEGFDFSQARVAAAIAVGGRKIMEETHGLMESLDYGFSMLSNMAGSATVHRGVYEDGKETLRIYTIIGGLSLPASRLAQLEKKTRGH